MCFLLQASKPAHRAPPANLMVAAFLWKVLPVPLADQGIVAVQPFIAGFKIFQHLLFGGAKSRVGFGHLAHANKYYDAFKHAEQLVYAKGILL